MDTVLANAPCYDPATDNDQTKQDCFDTIMRLAYLNQQSDGGALILRDGLECLTEEELDLISNKDVAENHPLNCAKLNAKPFPYFDGGVMSISKAGWFPFFSSRNNNFSNRGQTGIICVGDCEVDPVTGVLQNGNPAVTGGRVTRITASKCSDTANEGSGANNNGATSCIVGDGEGDDVLKSETFTTNEGDNDNFGDGNKEGCTVLKYNLNNVKTTEQQITLAIVLLFVGLFTAWLAYFLYNRLQLRYKEKTDHRGEKGWRKPGEAVEVEFT